MTARTLQDLPIQDPPIQDPPFQVKGIDHVVLRISDLSRSLAFYQAALGCHLERELPELGLFQLRAGHQLIDLVVRGSNLGGDTAVIPETGNLDHFCLTIDGFDESTLQQYFASLDIKSSEVGERYGAEGYGLSLYIEDPDGNTIELKQSN